MAITISATGSYNLGNGDDDVVITAGGSVTVYGNGGDDKIDATGGATVPSLTASLAVTAMTPF